MREEDDDEDDGSVARRCLRADVVIRALVPGPAAELPPLPSNVPTTTTLREELITWGE
jgi:hypothetical protein